MGKSFKGFSKALSLILAVAMVVTCVPTSAYAAELLSVDESEDLLISNDTVAEEASDALVTDDATASDEDDSSLLIDTQMEADTATAPEENTAGKEEEISADGTITKVLSVVPSIENEGDNAYDQLARYAYGDGGYNVKFTAKSGTATFSDANASVQLYKVDVMRWDLDGRGTYPTTLAEAVGDAGVAGVVNASEGAGKAKVAKVFKAYNDAQAAYCAGESADTRADWEAAKAQITANTSAMTLVPVPGSELPDSLGISYADGVMTFAVANQIREAYSGYFVVKVSDKTSGNENPEIYSPLFHIQSTGAFKNAIGASNDITFTVVDDTANTDNDITVSDTIPPKHDGKTSSYTLSSGEEADMVVFGYTGKQQGYKVYNKKEDIPRDKNVTDEDVVIANKITISPDAKVSSAINTSISDVQVEIKDVDTGDNKKGIWFDVSPENIVINNATGAVTLLVKPVEGLAADTYNAYIHVYHASAFGDEFIAKLSFTVGNDIKLKTYVNGEEFDASSDTNYFKMTATEASDYATANLGDVTGLYTYTAGTVTLAGKTFGTFDEASGAYDAGTTYYHKADGTARYPYNVGEFSIGTPFDTKDTSFVVEASGGVGGTTMSLAQSSRDALTDVGLNSVTNYEAGKAKLTGAFAQYVGTGASKTAMVGNLKKVGAEGVFTAALGDGTTPDEVKAAVFTVTATDTEGSAANMSYYIVPTLVDRDLVSMTIGDGTVSYPLDMWDANAYAWSAPKETTDVTTCTRTVTIKNDTAVELTYDLSQAVASGSFVGYTLTPTEKVVIPASETKTVTVAPVTPPDGNKNKATLSLGDATTLVGQTDITLEFTKASAEFEVTKPNSTLKGGSVIPSAEVGVAYEGFTFEYVENASVPAPTFRIKAVEVGGTFTGAVGGAATPSGSWTSLTAEEFATFTTDYGFSISADGTISGTPVKAAELKITVVPYGATTDSDAETTHDRIVYMHVTKPTFESAFKVTSGTTNISTTKALTLQPTDTASATGSEATINVENLLNADLGGLVATISDLKVTPVTGGPAVAANPAAFKVVYDKDDTALNTYLADYGLKIKKKSTKNLWIVSDPSKMTTYADTTTIIGGTYTAKVTFTQSTRGADFTENLEATITLVVTEKPVIKETGLGNLTNGEYIYENDDNGFKVAEPFHDDVHRYFWADYPADPTLEFTYAMADAEGTEVTIDQAGLKFENASIGGKVVGKITVKDGVTAPKKAGLMKVNVTATAPGVTVSKVYSIRIAGNATLTATIASQVLATNMVYVVPGLIKGETTGNKTTISFTTTAAVTGLHVDLKAAEDDRLPAEKAKSDIKNIYEANNSAGAFEITYPSTVPTGTGASAEVTVKTGTPGEFKVKATVTGDNISPVVFYLYAVVSDKLTISVPTAPTAVVGEKTHIEAKALGTTRNVTWKEVTAASDTASVTTNANSNLIKAGFDLSDGNFATWAATDDTTKKRHIMNITEPLKDAKGVATGENALIRSLVLSDDVKDYKLAQSGKAVTGVSIDKYGDSPLPKIGTYKFYLKATIAADNLNLAKHDGATDTNWKGSVTGVYKADTAYSTSTLTITGTDKAVIATASSSWDATAEKYSITPNKYDLEEGIDGTITGMVPTKVNNYTVKSVPAAATYTSSSFLVGIKNASDVALTGVKLLLDSSKFTIASTDSSNIKDLDANGAYGTVGGTTPDGSENKPYLVDLAAGKTTYILVTPKAGLKKGTYNATLTVKSVDLKADVTAGINFVVADKTQLVNVDYVNNGGFAIDESYDPDKYLLEDTYAYYKEENELEPVAANNALTATAGINLTPINKGSGAVAKDILFIRNSGNADIDANNITIQECTANGGAISAASDYLLEVSKPDDTHGNAPSAFSADPVKLATLDLPVTDADGNTTYNPTYILVRPRNAATLPAGTYTSYLKVSVKDGDPASFVIPVTFVIATKDLTNISYTPTVANINLAGVSEGYVSAAATGGEFTITNTAAATEGKEKGLYNLQVRVANTKFKLVPGNKDNIIQTAAEDHTILAIEPGASETFKIVPVEGLKAGTYETTVSITGGNIAAASKISKTVKVVVSQNTNFTAKVYSSDALANTDLTNGVKVASIITSYDPSFAQRLYRSLAALGAPAANPYTVAFAAADDLGAGHEISLGGVNYQYIQEATLDIDKNGTPETKVTFLATTAITGAAVADRAALVENMIIERIKDATPADQKLADPSYTISGISIDSYDTAYFATTPSSDYFTSLTFNEYSVVTFKAEQGDEYINAPFKTYEEKNDLVAVVGSTVDHSGTVKNVDKLITGNGGGIALYVIVPNGSAAAGSFTAGLPTVKFWNGESAFESWESQVTRKSVDNSTYVACDDVYVASWHGHTYPGSTDGDTEFIKWSWNADHTQATVTVKCTKPGCPDADKGAIVLDSKKGEIAIVDTKKDADCENGERHEFTATSKAASMPNGAVYTNTVKTDEDPSSIKGHKYQPTVTWAYNEATKDYDPTIGLVCTVCKPADNMKHRSETVSGNAITVSKTVVEPTCTEKGKNTYAITGFTAVGKSYTPADFATFTGVEWTKEVEVPAKGHNKELELTVENFDENTLSATVTATCPDDKVVVFGPAALTATKNEDGSYKFSFTGTDGVAYSVDWANHVHQWVPTWAEWKRTDESNKFSWSTSLTLTCTVGGKPETRTPAVTINQTPDGDKYIDFVATATYDKKTFTSDPWTVDAKTGEPAKKHECKWSLTEWKWASKDNATATFTCSVGKETKDVTATIVAVKTNTKGDTQYKATVTGPDGKEYSDLKWYDASGNPATGGGIEIVGLEEEYKFAGTAIKPAISVVDNDLGITLAEGTDYKISYKNNTKLGTATITVNGKGNYTGKNVTAEFKIVSATEGIEGLASKVNKVEKIAFNPTYTGEPQAPEKVTVVADGESIVYEWNGSEFQKVTDTTKDVGLTIVNNVNAGTATVAAVGADGKAKKANFKINKVDLSAVSAEQLAVEVEEEAAYLVKGAQPAVNVTYTPEGGSAIELINGQDFKVEYKYANKKNAGEGNTIKIKGYGANFTKAKEVADKPFKIVKHDLQDEDIVCVDAYTGIKPKKVKVVVKDSAGVVVPAKQYEVHVFTDEGLEITTDKNAKLEAGKEYTIQVKASASGNLEGEASAKVTAQANIGKAKATLSTSLKKDGVAYTGEPIDLENYQSGELIINYFESGIKLTLKGVGDLTYGEDFEVAGYVNNVNKGTMTVYVRGISDKCSGTLGIKVKISAKTMKKAE